MSVDETRVIPLIQKAFTVYQQVTSKNKMKKSSLPQALKHVLF
jgi:hypothetical protein